MSRHVAAGPCQSAYQILWRYFKYRPSYCDIDFSKRRLAAMLDFVVVQKWHKGMLRAVHGHQRTKFGEDISHCGWVMEIFLFFQNGGRPASWIMLQVKYGVTARCGLSMSTIMPNLETILQTAAELLRFSIFSLLTLFGLFTKLLVVDIPAA